MNLTNYQAKYFAYELTKRCSSERLEKLAGAVAAAEVDLNPPQVDAALFAFHSPLSKGALIAHKVGLAKTIEAGLVISQRWTERKALLSRCEWDHDDYTLQVNNPPEAPPKPGQQKWHWSRALR